MRFVLAVLILSIHSIACGEQYLFRYEDEKGTLNVVSDENFIPEKERLTLEDRRKKRTRVTIRNNAVLIPVKLTNNGITHEVIFTLDTGAAITTVNKPTASKIGPFVEAKPTTATVADGTKINTTFTHIDSIEVGNRKVSKAEVSIIEQDAAANLLGMSFLKYFKFHIDYNKQEIVWH